MDIERIARDLWAARVEGRTVDLADADRPPDAETAYAIQRAQDAFAQSAVVGWKIGAGNEKGMALLGLDAPFVGPLHERFVVRSGDTVALTAAHSPLLETEFLVRLAADLPPRSEPLTGAEVASATEAVCPAFELVGQRVPGPLAGAGPMLIADSGANSAVVVGAPVPDWRRFDLATQGVRTSVSGEERGAGDASVLMWGSPLAAVGWLLTHPMLADRGLRAGDIVMTGTCAGIIPVVPGDEALGDFGEFGAVHARFA